MGFTGLTLSLSPSLNLWTESCPLCIFNTCTKIQKNLANILKFVTLALFCFDLGSNMYTNSMGNHGAVGVSSECRCSSCSSWIRLFLNLCDILPLTIKTYQMCKYTYVPWIIIYACTVKCHHNAIKYKEIFNYAMQYWDKIQTRLWTHKWHSILYHPRRSLGSTTTMNILKNSELDRTSKIFECSSSRYFRKSPQWWGVSLASGYHPKCRYLPVWDARLVLYKTVGGILIVLWL